MPCAGGPGAGVELWLLLAGAAAAIGGALAIAIGWHAVGHRRVVQALRRTSRPSLLLGHEVVLVSGLQAPAVAGLARPRIYCPPDLADRLNERELGAVLLHERCHQLAHDPARLVVLAALVSILPHSDRVRRTVEGRIAGIEIAADRHALRAGARRADIAAALLKLGSAAHAPGFAGYASATELRLRHLVGGEAPEASRRSALLWLLAPVVAFMGCGLLSLIG